MTKIRIDISKALPFVDQTSFQIITEEVIRQHEILLSGTGKGNDHLGWLHLPSLATPGFISRIKDDSERIRSGSRLLVVIGIGGSYLGARAVIEALSDPFSAFQPSNKGIQVVYAGENLSEDYHNSLLRLLDEIDYSVAVISKSGTTTEPAVAFRIIKSHLEKKYGRTEAAGRVIAITDASKGALKKMAEIENYSTYIIPDDIGGRFSVLTPVGLLPVSVAGFDIGKLLEGARMMEDLLFSTSDPAVNPAVIYAAIRNALYKNGNGKIIEVLVNYEPRLFFFGEWWKQLFGESEGKENKGIFPAAVNFTTDLHSMGQYIQEGLRNLFETVISIEHSNSLLQVPQDDDNHDGLNYLTGKKLSEINRMAELGTMLAHIDGGVPNISISIPSTNEETIGQLIYFFEFSCALSGYTLGVNPFDQPGVEAYKKNMFALLGKPGFEQKGTELRKRL
jgi:glucose-6-phosphate isomerase